MTRDAIHLLLVLLIVQAVAAGQAILPEQTSSSNGKTPPQHVTISTSASALTAAPGSKVSLFIDVTPKLGIHVYAPGAIDYVPIAVHLKPVPDASFDKTTYPKSDTLTVAQDTVPVYRKPFRLVEEMTISPAAHTGSTVTVTGAVDYQACDDVVCFKPATVPVAWRLTIR